MAAELSQKARAFLQELRFAVLATINQMVHLNSPPCSIC